jgi:hypothetical protein
LISKITLIPYENISGTRVKPLGLVGFDFRPPSPDIHGMSKRKLKRSPSEIIAITRSPARRYGAVYAESEQQALAKAIEQFRITKPHEQKKLMVRPQR